MKFPLCDFVVNASTDLLLFKVFHESSKDSMESESEVEICLNNSLKYGVNDKTNENETREKMMEQEGNILFDLPFQEFLDEEGRRRC